MPATTIPVTNGDTEAVISLRRLEKTVYAGWREALAAELEAGAA